MNEIKTASAPAAVGPYSQGAVTESGLVITSGQLPINPATGTIESGCVKRQARQSLENVRAVLEAAGKTMADVAKTTVYLADIADFADVNEVYGEFFSAPYPARSCFQVGALPMGAKVEIEAMC